MNEIIITDEQEIALQTQNYIIDTLKALDDLKAREAELKEKLYEELESRGIKKIENESISITLVLPSTRESLDTKKLREEKPDIYDEYAKISPVKGSVRIKVK